MTATVLYGDALAFAEHLGALGAAIFTAGPGPENGPEFVRPKAWQHLDVGGNADRIAGWRPADALCVVLGDQVAVVDIDTKNGADVTAVDRLLAELDVTVFAKVATPGHGHHYYVAAHPDLPSVAAHEGRDGLLDLPGVEILTHGRNAFLPGTERPKYNGGGYRIEFDNLVALADGGDPDGAEALADWVSSHRAIPATSTTSTGPAAPPWDGTPPDAREQKYLNTALSAEVANVASTTTGARNTAVFNAAMKMGSYIAGAGLDEQRVVQELTAACVTNGLVADTGPASVLASIRSGLRNGRQNPKSVPPEKSTSSEQETADGAEGKKSAATVLVDLALATHRLGVSTDGEAFAVPLNGPRLVRPLRGGKVGLRAELARAYRVNTGRVVGQQALADALLALEGEAAESEPEALALRVAEGDGARWLDLGTVDGKVVRIDGDGWKVQDQAPVLFRRTILTAALPTPESGGSLDLLWNILNVDTADRPLLAAWLVSLFWPEIAHPIPALFGEQGTGKTTAARMLTILVDPSPAPVRKAPRDADSWVTAAMGSWVVALDNLSDVNPWLSDTLCRAVTGDGDVRRQLYTDGGLAVFAFRRCVLLTGIDIGAVRGDLADRLLIIDLHRIDARARREDSDLWTRWAEQHPLLLGAVLDLVASVASVLPSVHLESRPRMADFARIVAAVDEVLGTDGLLRYADRAGNLAIDSLSADAFVMAMSDQLAQTFTGTAAELMSMIISEEKRPPKGWPTTARAVTSLLKRQAPVMRQAGWTVDELKPGHLNVIRWAITRPEIARNRDSQDSQDSRSETDDPADASDASDARQEYGQSQDGEHICRDCRSPLLVKITRDRGQCEACRLAEMKAA